jgi:hypothetical protein
MPRRWLLVLSAVMVFHTDVLTQERGIELQGGAGYVLDPGEGPSVPAVIFGVVAWITRGCHSRRHEHRILETAFFPLLIE